MFKKVLNRLRFGMENLTFFNKFRFDLYEKMLGHRKVIGYEHGHPVHSLFMPALLSNAHRKMMVTISLAQMQNRRVPVMVNFGVTDVCNCKCDHCVFEGLRQERETLSGDEIRKTLDMCASLGVSVIAFLGGEPLLQKDIVSIINDFDTDSNTLLLFTNGSNLAEYASDLKNAGLSRLLVSIEYPDAARHDRITQHKNLFNKAIEGIQAAQKAGMLVGASVTIHHDTTADDLKEIFQLAKKLKLVEIFLSKEINRDNPNKSICVDDSFLQEVKRVNRDSSYKFGIMYYQLFSSVDGFGGCSAGGTRMYISPYGDVTPCDAMKRSFGNVKTDNLHDIWHRMTNTPGFGTVYGPCRFKLDYNNSESDSST